jgi:hypothetical protein
MQIKRQLRGSQMSQTFAAELQAEIKCIFSTNNKIEKAIIMQNRNAANE